MVTRKLWRWLPGRGGRDYTKFCLWSFWRADAYLLRFPKSSMLAWHTDEVPGRKHWRLNITIRRSDVGGDVYVEERVQWRVSLFRPDAQLHRVGWVDAGELWLLSFGVAL